MKIEHTPEPWGAGTEVYMSAKAEEAYGPAFVYPHGHNQALCIANAQRIVVCVNACKGIDNETLIHTGVVQRGELGDAIRQRDILLETLQKYAEKEESEGFFQSVAHKAIECTFVNKGEQNA